MKKECDHWFYSCYTYDSCYTYEFLIDDWDKAACFSWEISHFIDNNRYINSYNRYINFTEIFLRIELLRRFYWES